MIIDRSHRVWFVGSVLALAAAGLLFLPYAFSSVTGVSGGSKVGLIYGSLGSAMMLFAGLLGARKKFPTWRVGRATFWMRAHLVDRLPELSIYSLPCWFSNGWRIADANSDGIVPLWSS